MSVGDDQRPNVWTYEVASEKWNRLPDSPTAPKLIGVFEPGRGRAPLMYDAKLNAFYLIARKEDKVETWAYRYSASSSKP